MSFHSWSLHVSNGRKCGEANWIIDEKACVILAFCNHSISWTTTTVSIWLIAIWLFTHKRRQKKNMSKKCDMCVAIIDSCDKKSLLTNWMIERENGQIGDKSHNYVNCSTELHFTVKCDCYSLLYIFDKNQHAIFNLGLKFLLPVGNQLWKRERERKRIFSTNLN